MDLDKQSSSSYQNRLRKKKNILNNWFADPKFLSVIALLFLLLILVPLAKNYSRQRIVDKEVADMQTQIKELEAKNKNLKVMADYLRSDASLEEQARLNMGLKKPGEKVVVVQNKAAGALSEENNESQEIPNWKKWLQYFMN